MIWDRRRDLRERLMALVEDRARLRVALIDATDECLRERRQKEEWQAYSRRLQRQLRAHGVNPLPEPNAVDLGIHQSTFIGPRRNY